MNVATRSLAWRSKRGSSPALLALELAMALAVAGPLAARETVPPSPEPIQIFFPPVPPPSGAPHASAAETSPGKEPAPPGLAPYVGEPFYAPLSTRFARSEIGDDLDFRLRTYLASQSSLLTELRARLHTLKNADPAARVRALEEFAHEQTPRIDALEQEAESLREDLSEHGSGYAAWQRWRRRLLAGGKNPITPALQLEIIRMDVFYREGLSPAQRRLLSGNAVERADDLAPPPLPPDERAGAMFYFSPATARIFLPPNLSPGLRDEIAAYTKERSGLEHELIEALYGPSVPSSQTARLAALHALDKTQEARLAALETAAEEIRRSLALLNDPGRPADLPDLPPDLAARIAACRAEDLALNKALLARREEVMKSNPAADSATLEEKISQAFAAFSAENAARFAALDKSKDAVRADLAKLPGATAGSADALLMKNSESLRRLQAIWDYRDYQTAALQPGLSPEQRRLLFAGALQKLALPLPGEEIHPGPL